jgi:hypothetical protein
MSVLDIFLLSLCGLAIAVTVILKYLEKHAED